MTRNAPPVDTKAEQNVIALMLLAPKSCVEVAGVMLNPTDFVDKLWRAAFEEVLLCYGEYNHADVATVVRRMQHKGTLTSDDATALGRAAATAVNYELIEFWAREVLHDALKRELQNIAEIPLACEGCGSHFDFSLRSNATIEETITMAQRKIDKIATRLTPLRHAAVTEEELRNAVKAYSRTLNEETKNGCVPMAYHELTNAIGGKVPLGTLITIGGLPGNAKTLLLIQSLLAAANAGLTSVIFSQEMGYNAIGERVADMLCKRSKTSYTEQELNRLADEYFDGLEGKVIFRQVANTGDAVAAEIARCKQKYNASVFALDYLQLLGGNTAKSYERVTYNASVIRAATSSNNVTMFLAAQLNRSVMGSIPPIPKKHHFRDSGQIEQDADVILMLRHPVKDSSVEDVAKFLEQTEFDCRPEEYFEIRIDKLRNRKLEGVKVVPAVLKGQPLQLSTIKYKPESTPEN